MRCEYFTHLRLCAPARHLPGWFTISVKPSTISVKPSTPSVEESNLPDKPYDPALVHLDINKLNKPNNQEQTLKTGLEVSQVEEIKNPEPEKQLPPNWEKQIWIVAKKLGFQEPRQIDKAHAWNTYEETGLDLEPGGIWETGKEFPRPAHSKPNNN